MVRPPILRTKSVTTKVTEAEYARLEERAALAGLNLSEWIRRLLGDEEPGGGAGSVVLAELLALRTILMNLLFSISRGEVVTPEQMQALIERADKDKVRRALEKLASERMAAPSEAAKPIE